MLLKITLLFLLFFPSYAAAQIPANLRAVCRIGCRVGTAGGGFGSGALVHVKGDRGLVLTCHHVAQADGIVQVLFDYKTVRPGVVVKHDKVADLSLIQIPVVRGITPLQVTTRCSVEHATISGYGTLGNYQAHRGPVVWSAFDKDRYHIVFGMPVRSGDSGGPVTDSRGRVIGVVWGSRSQQSYASSGPPFAEFVRNLSSNYRDDVEYQWWDEVYADQGGPRMGGPVPFGELTK